MFKINSPAKYFAAAAPLAPAFALTWVLAFASLGPMPVAKAGTLSMVNVETYNVSVRDQKIFLSGIVDITNKGDEQSFDVFPRLTLANWTWQGPPVVLSPNENHHWAVEENFAFPGVKGEYPLLQMINYRDVNGHKFSAPTIRSLKFGNFDLAEEARLRAPAIRLRMNYHSDNQTFIGKLKIENLSEESQLVNIIYFTSDELSVPKLLTAIEVSAANPQELKFEIKNTTGTFGSAYPVFAIAQWESHGLHLTSQTSQLVKLTPEDRTSYFLVGGVIAFLLVSLVSAFYFWRVVRGQPA